VRRSSRPFRPDGAACAALRLTVKSAIPTAAKTLRGQNLPDRDSDTFHSHRAAPAKRNLL
jgi:hypothetical protein